MMRVVAILSAMLVLAGCAAASKRDAKLAASTETIGTADERSSFFALPIVEGRASETISIDLRGPYRVSSALIVMTPEEYRGTTLWLRFKSTDDEGYRLLSRTSGRLVRIEAQDGRGIMARNGIILVSDAHLRITLLDKAPNKAPEPTPTAVTSPAAQEPRQP